jgi:hypothetical protein
MRGTSLIFVLILSFVPFNQNHYKQYNVTGGIMSNVWIKQVRKLSAEALEHGSLRVCKKCGKPEGNHKDNKCLDKNGYLRHPVTSFECGKIYEKIHFLKLKNLLVSTVHSTLTLITSSFNKIKCGTIEDKVPYKIRLQVMKTEDDLMRVNDNKNCPWKWITFKKESNTLAEAKEYLNSIVGKVLANYQLNLED